MTDSHVHCSPIVFWHHFCLGHPLDHMYPNSFATKLSKLHDISAFYDMVDKLCHLDILLQLQGEFFEDTLKEAVGSISAWFQLFIIIEHSILLIDT